MAELKIFHDREGQTLTVWFGVPADEVICEEAAEDFVVMKDRSGRVIGVEKLNFSVPESESLNVVLEVELAGSKAAELDRRWLGHVQHPESAIPWEEVRRKLIDRE